MKRIYIPENVIIENRSYKAGEYNEADIPAQDLEELLRTGFGELIAEASKLDEADKLIAEASSAPADDLKPQDLFPSEVLEEDLQNSGLPTFEEILSKSVKEIREELPGLSDEALLFMLAKEAEGKDRKGVIEAIETAIESRVEPDADNSDGDNAE